MKDTKKCFIKGKFKFQDYKHCLEATQLENEIIQLRKFKLDVDSLLKNYKKITKK